MKFIGSALIIIASICASFFYEKKLKAEIHSLNEAIDFILYVKTQILYYSKPINEIYKDYNKTSLFLQEILESKEKATLTNFNKESKEKLTSFLSTIGKGFKSEQISLCEDTITYLNEQLTRLEAEYSKKTKAYRSISLFVGVCVVILLI